MNESNDPARLPRDVQQLKLQVDLRVHVGNRVDVEPCGCAFVRLVSSRPWSASKAETLCKYACEVHDGSFPTKCRDPEAMRRVLRKVEEAKSNLRAAMDELLVEELKQLGRSLAH